MKSYLDQVYADERTNKGMRLLMSAIVDRALRDIMGKEPELGDHEMVTAAAFLFGGGCQGICVEIGADYKALKKEAATLYTSRIERKFFSGRA